MYNGIYEVASLVYIYMYMYVQKRYFPLWSQSMIKDARSVSFYPYNRSQILQYVEYTK